RGGLLQIGPESAGSDPGPACYGQGNDRPTVTDANVVLGRINAGRPIGGKLSKLDVAAARRAIDGHVGNALGLDTMAAAEAIVRVTNSRMAGAIRLVSIERGHDPKRFVAMPFGGGGALHAGALLKEVGLAKALVPRFPGVTSALGCVIADMRHDFVRTVNRLLDDLDPAALERDMIQTAQAGLELLDRAGVDFGGRDIVWELDMSYVGQTHTVSVPLELAYTGGPLGLTVARVRAAFDLRYRQVYRRLLDGIAVRLLNLRTATIGRRPKFDLSLLAPSADCTKEKATIGQRPVWADGGWSDAMVYRRLDLPVGARIAGPAILEQPDTTTFVDPDLEAEVDRFGNLIIQRPAAQRT
ncbi:MAG: hydantoinase/oxoprolinase family protein, partial [Alphaproteobacteria bacterium]|nr:hydantoinase/oxoprolinase family protein [Alphaproteobacteria bacterium]